ncbi:MAG: phosphoribosylformylglycinamidine synthase subunit PurQ, partial [Pseudomonadota bacterium]
MITGVVVFPGSNCDRDMMVALTRLTGQAPARLWWKETALPPGLDLVAIPGGFSFGDYLRTGAIAARAPVMVAVARFAADGGRVLGVCNGFQVMIEAGLLPGALMRNAGLRFVCRRQHILPEGPFAPLGPLAMPVAHHDGNYVADAETLARLRDEDRIAVRYADATGAVTEAANPNGSTQNIAGITGNAGRLLGLMPHPERAAEPAHGSTDGARLLTAFLEAR